MTKLMRRFRRNQEKINNKMVKVDKQNRFNLDPLEPRLLLSGDPISVDIVKNINDNNLYDSLNTITSTQTSNSSNIIDLANFKFDNTTFTVDNNTILKGSGTAQIDLINNNIVAPGYSPGVQTVSSYTQDVNGILQIELGGTTAGTGDGYYDQLNITTDANFGGTLEVSLWKDFKPKVGDTFDIITFGGNATGLFTNLKGFYGFESDYYFELVQTSNKIQLVTKEIISGNDFAFISKDLGSKNDSLGMLLNKDYLTSAAPTSVTLSANIDLGNNFHLSGNVTYSLDTTSKSLLLSNDSTVSVNTTKIEANNLTAFFGVENGNNDFGLSFNDADFSVLIFDPISNTDTRTWVLSEGNLAGSSFTGLDELTFSSGTMSFLVSQGLGTSNTTVANLSGNSVTVGAVTFDDDGTLGEQLYIAGNSLSLSLDNIVNISGNLLFGANNTTFYALGDNLTTSMNTGAFSVEVNNASFALVSSASGTALKATGSLSITGGEFTNVRAQTASLVYNNSNVAYSDYSISVGSSTYVIDGIEASTSLLKISATGLETTIAGVFTFLGDVDFSKNGTTIDFISSNANVALFAGSSSVGVKNANVGFSIDSSGKRVLEARGGLNASLNDSMKLGAVSSNLFFKDAGLNIDNSNKTLSLGSSNFTFSDVLLGTQAISEVRVDEASIELDSFFYAKGNFAFKQSALNLKDSNGNNVSVDLLTLGASNIEVFAGLNGGTSDASGLVLAGANFAFAIANERTGQKRVWNTLKASANGVSVVGFDDLVLNGTNLSVEINTKSADNTYLDYASTPLEIYTSTTTFETIDYSKSFTKLSGNLDINVGEFFSFTGNLGFFKSNEALTLDDGSVVEADVLTLGASSVNAFAGLTGANKVGLDLKEVDLGLFLATDINNNSRNWLSVQALAKEASFIGMSDITLSSSNIEVTLNKKSSDNRVIDFNKDNYEIVTGTNSSMNMDIDGSLGESLKAKGDVKLSIYDFVNVEETIAFSKDTQTLKVDKDGVLSDTLVDVLTFGVNDLDIFAGLNGNSNSKIGLDVQDASLAFLLAKEKVASNARVWTALNSKADGASFVGIDNVTMEASEIEIKLNQSASDNSLLDFTTSKKIYSENGTFLDLDMKSSEGELLEVQSNINLNLFNFFSFDGRVAIEKKVQDVTVYGEQNKVSTDMLLVGAQDVQAFVGLNGGSSDAVGLELIDVDFAFGIFADKNNNSREWTTLKADVGSAAFIGIDDLKVGVESLNIAINQSAIDGTVLDLSSDSITVLGTTLDIDGSRGELLEASGQITLDVFGFFSVNGEFAIKKSTQNVSVTDGVNVANDEEIAVDMLTIGGNNVNAFAGLNGGTSEAMGLALSGVDFALAIANDKDDKKRTWTTLQATVDSVGVVGIEGLTLSATNLEVQINQAAIDSNANKSWINYNKTNLEVKTGISSSITLDMDGMQRDIIRAVGEFEFNFFNFFATSGTFAFEKKTTTLDVVDNKGTASTLDDVTTQTLVNLLTIGGSGIDAFAGMNGGSADELGLKLVDAQFALVMASDKDKQENGKKRKWTSLKASAQKLSFVGIEGLTVSGTNLNVEINKDAKDGTLLDYSAHELDVLVGPNQTVSLDMKASDGELTRASGTLNLNLFNFFAVNGDFGFEKSTKEVTLTTGETIDVDYMAIGASDVSAFAGLNYGSEDKIGLLLGSVDFALALMSDKTNKQRKFTTLKADANNVSFTGIDGLIVEANQLNVVINKGYKTAAVAAQTINENTKLLVQIAPQTVGKVSFGMDAEINQDMLLDGSETDAELITKIKTTIAGFESLALSDISVSGSSIGGFTIEFVGTKAGSAGSIYKDMSIYVTPAEATSTVTQINASTIGANEIKQISINIPTITPPQVNISSAQTISSIAGTNEIKKLIFSDPKNSKGNVTLSYNGTSASFAFVGTNTTTTKNNIQTALNSVYGVGNTLVTFDGTYKAGFKYDIEFIGTLAGQNVPDMTINWPSSTIKMVWNETSATEQGVSLQNETQTLTISNPNDATGSYKLSLKYNNVTYTTSSLALNATSSQIQSALNSALNSLGATVSVTQTISGTTLINQITFGGALAGKDVANLTAVKSINVDSPSGTFTIASANKTTQTVSYNQDTTIMAANIKTAITTLYGLNSSDVTVSYDVNSSTNYQNYLITFVNGASNTNIADISTNDVNLVNASVKPYNVTQGKTAVGEVQKVVINTAAKEGTFTLTYDGKTTTAISFKATRAEVITALNSIAPSGATITLGNWSGKELTLSFGGNLAGINTPNVVVSNITPKAYDVNISTIQIGTTTNIAAQSAGTVVVDYSNNHTIDVLAGTGKTITLDIDGSLGEVLKVYGNVNLNIANIITVQGGFGFEKSTASINISGTQNPVSVDMLTFGMAGVDAFVGYGAETTDTSDDIGLKFSDVNLALIMAKEKSGSRKWSAIDSTIGSAEILGISGFELSVNQAAVLMNKAASDNSVMDFNSNNLTVTTGVDNDGVTRTVDFDLDGSKGAMTKVEANIKIAIDSFFVI